MVYNKNYMNIKMHICITGDITMVLSNSSKHRPSSSKLQADFVFPNTLDEFAKGDFYWSQFSLVQLGRLLVQLML